MSLLPYLYTRYRLLCISNSRKRGSLNLWEGVWWWDFKWTKTHRYNVPHCLAIYFASQSKCIIAKKMKTLHANQKFWFFWNLSISYNKFSIFFSHEINGNYHSVLGKWKTNMIYLLVLTNWIGMCYLKIYFWRVIISL